MKTLRNDREERISILKNTKKPYAWLLAVNLFISTFTFGGGYVVVPMIRRYFVEQKKYFTEEDLAGMAAVAQSTPGAIAINLSALSGYRVAGTPGAVLSCTAAVIPPLVILGLVSAFYTAFMSNVVVSAILKGMQDVYKRQGNIIKPHHRHILRNAIPHIAQSPDRPHGHQIVGCQDRRGLIGKLHQFPHVFAPAVGMVIPVSDILLPKRDPRFL